MFSSVGKGEKISSLNSHEKTAVQTYYLYAITFNNCYWPKKLDFIPKTSFLNTGSLAAQQEGVRLIKKPRDIWPTVGENKDLPNKNTVSVLH